MNNSLKTALLGFITLAVVSCKETKTNQESSTENSKEIQNAEKQMDTKADASFTSEMAESVYANYQELRVALVNSDASAAQTAAINLVDNVLEEQADMRSSALAMADATDIEKQRQLFSELTQHLEPMLKESISEGTLYKQFCPMAFEGNGGYWISNSDEIRNPYYGDKMLKCGKVVEEIH
ncbi:MAG: DUF3347 domain-containing protein [Maribacter sp.]